MQRDYSKFHDAGWTKLNYHKSSREPGIERSRSFLCLFIIFTAQKMPILSVKRIIEMSLVDDATSTLSDLWPLFSKAPCLSQDSSVIPSTSVCPPLALSVCIEVLSESRNLPMPVSKGIFRSGRIIRLASSADKAILLTCSVKTS